MRLFKFSAAGQILVLGLGLMVGASEASILADARPLPTIADPSAVLLPPAPPPRLSSPTPVAAAPGDAVRLPGHVLDVVATGAARREADRVTRDSPMTLTVVLRRDDPAGFDQYLGDVYDANSPRYRHFLKPAEVTRRFGPSLRSYREVASFLASRGLKVVARSKNRLTLSVRGERPRVEQAFALKFADYHIADRAFAANTQDPAVPARLAMHIQSIEGLSELARPQASVALAKDFCAAIASLVALSAFRQGNVAEQAAFRALVNGSFDAGAAAAVAKLKAGYAGRLAVYVGVVCAGALAGAALGDYLDNASGGTDAGGTGPQPQIKVRPWVNRFLNSFGSYEPPDFDLTDDPLSVDSTANAKRQSIRVAGVESRRIKAATGAGGTAPVDGTGQTIGLVEFDTFNRSDVSDYLALIGAPSSQIDQLSTVHVNGGVTTPGAAESEVLLDIDTIMAIAPGAKVAVYDVPFTGHATDYSAAFNAMINGGVTIISNSWASCEDQVSQADALGIDTVLAAAAASGITVLNGAGDTGSTCLDGRAGVISVPADSPHATAVGGTSFSFGPGFTYGSEVWWGSPSSTPNSGQGGYGVSRYFATPSYQTALNSGPNRSIPDVAIPADPTDGGFICQADANGCPTGLAYGGTSIAAPLWASVVAIINGHNGGSLGALNPQIYLLAATVGFHGAASMGSDFAHVGLGSPSIAALGNLLAGTTPGVPDAAASHVDQLAGITPAGLTFPAPPSLPADGATVGVVNVALYDAGGNPVSGKAVTLSVNAGTHATVTPTSATSGAAGIATFQVTDLTPEVLIFNATDTTDSVAVTETTGLIFTAPAAASAGLDVQPATVPADGQSSATITVTLKDALGRPSSGKAVKVLAGAGHAVITGPASGLTDASGQIQFAATNQVNEAVTFTAIDVTDGNLPVPGSSTVTYSGSAASLCGAQAPPVAADGYAITPFVRGLPASNNLNYGNINFGCPGATTPAFTAAGSVLIADFLTGALYKTGVAGGTVSSSDVTSHLGLSLGSLTYGKDGSVYATLSATTGDFTTGAIIQVDPLTGANLRTVAAGLTCPANLAVDPLSGDLFFDDFCTGAGADNPALFRVVDPANTDPTRPTAVVVYATLPSSPNAGMAFAPNGALYVVIGYIGAGNPSGSNAAVVQVSGTNSPTVTITPIPGVTSDFPLAIGTTNSDGSAASLIVEPGGVLKSVPLANPAAAVTIASGAPGIGTVGPDGCIYSAKYDTIFRLTNADGTCSNTPSSPGKSIVLAPASVTPAPAQGTLQTVTATLQNFSSSTGVPVLFEISGANAQFKIVHTDANGRATLSYVARQPGADAIVAVVPMSDTSIASNIAHITWTAGLHVTALTLNGSPRGAVLNAPITAVASLTDTSSTPFAPLAGQPILFAAGAATCTATSDATGMASCALTPAAAGAGSLTANFAGASGLAAASTAASLNVSTASAAVPVVTLAFSPSTVVVNGPSTLTWSSQNAAACTATGGWSGSEPTSGTLVVTPAAAGSVSYGLSCTGDGGMTAATAVLVATLPNVTVSSRGGGGALNWGWLAALALVLMLRPSHSLSRSSVRVPASLL